MFHLAEHAGMTSRLLLRRLSSGSSEAGSSTTGGEDAVSDEPLHGNMFATTALSGVAGAGNATTFGNVTTFEVRSLLLQLAV